MSAPVDDPVCLCGDRQSEHRLGRKGCKALDCGGCAAFEAADDVRSGNAQPDYAQAEECKPAHSAPGQSTSARLREVERELAEAQQLVDQKQQRLLEASDLLTGVRAKQEQTERERDLLKAKLDAALLKMAEQVDARNTRIGELAAQLEHAEQYARDLQDNGDVAPVEIHGWDAWQCLTCGSRYRLNFDHEHGPLTAVRVSITER